MQESVVARERHQETACAFCRNTYAREWAQIRRNERRTRGNAAVGCGGMRCACKARRHRSGSGHRLMKQFEGRYVSVATPETYHTYRIRQRKRSVHSWLVPETAGRGHGKDDNGGSRRVHVEARGRVLDLLPRSRCAWRGVHIARGSSRITETCASIFALHEVAERRAAANRVRRRRGAPPAYCPVERIRLVNEIHALVGGVGGRHIQLSLRRLERVGLVVIEGSGIRFTSSPTSLMERAQADTYAMLRRIDARRHVLRRRVPLPRSTVRLLSSESRPGVMATVLGYAIRCLWLKRASVSSTGSCAASFIAQAFGVHIRTIKRARRQLSRRLVAQSGRRGQLACQTLRKSGVHKLEMG
jgi:hypothetical protein